jgi:hypothetical protein
MNGSQDADEHHEHDQRHERRHRAPYDGPGWSEAFACELSTGDGFGVAVHVVIHPFERRTWYWAVVERPGEPVVAVVDLDVPMPTRDASLELRTDGLWADQNVEIPWRHVSVGLEAFGLSLDDPQALLGDGRGDRVPVGLDLEWESDPVDVRGRVDDDVAAFEVAGRAHGELLVGADAFELDGFGWREHRWGSIDWWDPDPDGRLWVASAQRRRDPAHRFSGVAFERDGLGPVALPAAPTGAQDQPLVEFQVPSFGRRAARILLGRARRSDDLDAGTGWLFVRMGVPEARP